MGASEYKKTISTTIEKELWKQAQVNDISWARALEVGVEILLGSNLDLEAKKERVAKLRAEAEGIEFQIKKLEAEREAKVEAQESELEDVMPYLDLLKETSEALSKNPNFIKGRTKIWNNKTGQNLRKIDLLELCRRCERGEFNGGSNNGADVSNG